MPRVKRGTHRIKRRKNILARTKGMMWGRKSKITLAKTAAKKAGQNAFRDRRLKKRDNRALNQVRIGAGAKELGTSYSRVMGGLGKKNIKLNRTVLAKIASEYPDIFKKIVEMSK